MASYVITGDTASLCNNLSLLFISKVGGVWGLYELGHDFRWYTSPAKVLYKMM